MKLRNRTTDEGKTAQQGPYGLAILLELNRSGRHIYNGTVDPAVKAVRRRRNKAARVARRAGR